MHYQSFKSNLYQVSEFRNVIQVKKRITFFFSEMWYGFQKKQKTYQVSEFRNVIRIEKRITFFFSEKWYRLKTVSGF